MPTYLTGTILRHRHYSTCAQKGPLWCSQFVFSLVCCRRSTGRSEPKKPRILSLRTAKREATPARDGRTSLLSTPGNPQRCTRPSVLTSPRLSRCVSHPNGLLRRAKDPVYCVKSFVLSRHNESRLLFYRVSMTLSFYAARYVMT